MWHWVKNTIIEMNSELSGRVPEEVCCLISELHAYLLLNQLLWTQALTESHVLAYPSLGLDCSLFPWKKSREILGEYFVPKEVEGH